MNVDEKSLAKKSTFVRITYVLLNSILVIDGHSPMKFIKLKLAIPLEFCRYMFDTESPRCLVAIKVVIVPVLKYYSRKENALMDKCVNKNVGMARFWSFQACFFIIGQKYVSRPRQIY